MNLGCDLLLQHPRIPVVAAVRKHSGVIGITTSALVIHEMIWGIAACIAVCANDVASPSVILLRHWIALYYVIDPSKELPHVHK